MDISILKPKIIAMRKEGEGMENDGHYWTEEDINHLIEDHNDGIGISEMAVEFGRSENAIIQQMYREGLLVTPETKKRHRDPKPEPPTCETCKLKEECAKLREKCQKLTVIKEK